MLILTRLNFGFDGDTTGVDVTDVVPVPVTNDVGKGGGGGTSSSSFPLIAADNDAALVTVTPPTPSPMPKLSGLLLLGGTGGFTAATIGQIDTLRAGIDVERVKVDLSSANSAEVRLVGESAVTMIVCVDSTDERVGFTSALSDVDVEANTESRAGTGFLSGFFVACLPNECL